MFKSYKIDRYVPKVDKKQLVICNQWNQFLNIVLNANILPVFITCSIIYSQLVT